MAPIDRSEIALSRPRFGTSLGAGSTLLCVLLLACGNLETSKARSPIGSGGVGGGGSGGVGGAAGQGGLSGGTGGAGAGGMTALPMGGGGGAAGMVGSGGSGGAAGGGAGGVAGTATGGSGGMLATGGSGGGGGSGGSAPTGDFCERWSAARENLVDPEWNGSTASCDPGEMPQEALDTALGLVNFYRSLVELPAVAMTAQNNERAQTCALLMAANGSITHTPPTSWNCYTEEGADAAMTSSVSSGPALESIDGYMIDPGNPTTIGHRRWILSSMLSGIGFGSAGRFSCQYQPAQRPPAGAPDWVAWPPPGQISIEAFGAFFAKLDQTGWSVQSDSIDFGNADVTVTSGGEDLPVTVNELLPGYGSTFAMRFNAMGWESAAGKTYHVAITGTSTPIEYDVEVVDCP
jgi:hypothetical protein